MCDFLCLLPLRKCIGLDKKNPLANKRLGKRAEKRYFMLSSPSMSRGQRTDRKAKRKNPLRFPSINILFLSYNACTIPR